MQKFIILAALLGLAACATPQQQCISNASAAQNSIVAQVQVAEGNIARGFAIHRQNVPYTYIGICHDGAGKTYTCEMSDFHVKETPVAINVAEERHKLAGLQRQFTALSARTNAAISQCRMMHSR